MIDEKKLIEKIWNIFSETYNNAFNFDEDESKLVERVMIDVQNAIEEQPKIGGWIPCSERLPDKVDNYIIHTITGTGEDYVGMWIYERGVHLSGKQTYIDDKQGYWANPYNGYPINEHLSKNVVAWQPLPEKYHGQR